VARSSRPAHNTPIEFSEITASLLAARGARLLLVATQAEALAALAQELGASGAVVTTCTAASPRSTDFRGSVALAYQICEFRFRQALETRAPGCLRRLVRWFTGQSTLKLQQTVFALACLALGACSAELAEPRQFPQRVEGGNFTLYVSNQSFAIDPVDINVYFDDTLVVVRDFEVGSQHNWHEFEVVLTPGAHTRARPSSKRPSRSYGNATACSTSGTTRTENPRRTSSRSISTTSRRCSSDTATAIEHPVRDRASKP
jgi:hypothetical protein